MAKPTVAIVGRPNVGKSTLFNKIIGQRRSIVDDTPGITRDRIYGDADWNGYYFSLIDTGGLELDTTDEIKTHVLEQARIALDMSDCIIMVTDIHAGVTAADIEIAELLTRSGKPILLAVNKVDRIGEVPLELYDFYSLGIGTPIPISSIHGYGTGDLLDEVTKSIPKYDEDEELHEEIKVAIIGRPNVGKSTLINTILKEQRLIVSEIAGTTRDAVDAAVTNQYGNYVFIDTAGMRRKGRISADIERYSVMRALSAVDRADVAVIMLDATEGYAEQDSKVAGYAHEQGKGCIIAINKWDLVEKDTKTMDNLRKKYMNDFSFMPYAPIIFISGKTGQRIERLYELINFVNEQNSMRISTGMLNELLARATSRVQPPSDKGRRLKIFYITQASTRPPTFVVFVNKAELFHFSYARYIENQIRDTFGLEGTPIRMIVREREQK
ncbi:MAG: ribosome biogenesis GTPase Der [Oscillospiraceae bacterium]|nr:ribosome biogenesis GTPase Der [Oscillospiraceae bacterium]